MADPRVMRTRRRVIDATRQLMADGTTIPVTVSAIAAASAVSRKTIYVHWGTVSEIMRDVLLDTHVRRNELVDDVTSTDLRGFLRSTRDVLADPGTHGVLAYLVRTAAHDPDAADVLTALAGARLRELAELIDRPVSEHGYALLVGPVFFRQMITGLPADDALIDRIVASWEADELAVVSSGAERR